MINQSKREATRASQYSHESTVRKSCKIPLTEDLKPIIGLYIGMHHSKAFLLNNATLFL